MIESLIIDSLKTETLPKFNPFFIIQYHSTGYKILLLPLKLKTLLTTNIDASQSC